MTSMVIAFDRRVISKSHGFTAGAIRNEANFCIVENITAAQKRVWPFSRLFKKIGKRRHAAVVKIGRAQPHAIERHRGITAGFTKMTELPWPAGADGVHLLNESRGE